MIQHRRRAEIVRRLRCSGPLSAAALAGSLGVSASTIRRDLAELSKQGTLTRVHGGAHAEADADVDMPFANVAAIAPEDKDAVAGRALELVNDGDVLLLDIGTTVAHLARRLRGRRVTVLTSSLAVLDELREDECVELLVLGGLVRRTYHSLVGALTEDALRQVRADRAFIGASGVRGDGQVLDSTLVETPIKRALIAAAGQVVLLADKGKFPGTGALRVCGVDELDVLITNAGADSATLDTCSAAGVEVMLACD
ncbi:DeoR/GlpR family DNA-binding transcription regulator [Sciscionella sediminilitoris]|uniref:DeoR/GlpR family DNA-binding transcription regulator n=1 Tax=Sciscionella sediminilitoris TaxID=1445613 RepID=UPI0004DF7D37|nr:DeoR/GlpR family DNA-binding transcription regulator [Sciscionella sp. SE31]